MKKNWNSSFFILFSLIIVFSFVLTLIIWNLKIQQLNISKNFKTKEITISPTYIPKATIQNSDVSFVDGHEYKWNNNYLLNLIKNSEWEKIDYERLSGITLKYEYVEKVTEGCGDDSKLQFLRFEGGLCQKGYWLEDSKGETIRNQNQLINMPKEVDSKELAVSYIGLLVNDLKKYDNDIIDGKVIELTNGYMVEVVRNNTFGCSDHRPSGIIYFIENNGNYYVAANEILPIITPSNIVCVD